MKLVACLLLLFVAASFAIRVNLEQQLRQSPHCGCHHNGAPGPSANPNARLSSPEQPGGPEILSPNPNGGAGGNPVPNSLQGGILGQPAPQQVEVMVPANFGCCEKHPESAPPMLPPPDNLIPNEMQEDQPEDLETALAPVAEQAPPPKKKESCCPDSVTVIRNSNKIIRKSKTAKL